jgi:cytochrome c oxidase subunit 3
MPRVATAAVIDGAPAHAPSNRPNLVSVGTIVWLASELMFFAALFAMFFTMRSVNASTWSEFTKELNVPFATVNTLILISSSVTCQAGVFAAERGDAKRLRFWFIITFILGAIFVSGQAYEYTNLVKDGITLSSSAFGSIFYLTTGFHAMHVTGGLIAFLFVLGRLYVSRRFTHRQATSAIVVSYYWHFVDVVWIFLFSIIYLLPPPS